MNCNMPYFGSEQTRCLAASVNSPPHFSMTRDTKSSQYRMQLFSTESKQTASAKKNCPFSRSSTSGQFNMQSTGWIHTDTQTDWTSCVTGLTSACGSTSWLSFRASAVNAGGFCSLFITGSVGVCPVTASTFASAASKIMLHQIAPASATTCD